MAIAHSYVSLPEGIFTGRKNPPADIFHWISLFAKKSGWSNMIEAPELGREALKLDKPETW